MDTIVFCVVLCVLARGVPPRHRDPIPFLIATNQCELVGYGFDPIKLHHPTMQVIMVISDVIGARQMTVVMVEKA